MCGLMSCFGDKWLFKPLVIIQPKQIIVIIFNSSGGMKIMVFVPHCRWSQQVLILPDYMASHCRRQYC